MQIEQLAGAFSEVARERGARRWGTTTVTILEASPTAIRAVAKGAEEYDVSLDLRSGYLELSCSCPAFEIYGPCKHLWTTALLAAERGLLAALPSSWSGIRHIRLGDWEEEAGEPSVDSRVVTRSTESVRAPLRVTAPGWATLFSARVLDQALQRPPVATPEILLYVIEAEPTRQSGELTLSLRTRGAKKKGGFTKDKPAELALAMVDLLPDDHDRQALPLFHMAATVAGDDRSARGVYYSGYGYVERFAARARITPAIGRQLLPLLAQTGRLFVRPVQDAEPTPATYQDAPAWEFILALRRREASPTLEVEGRLERNGQSVPLSTPLALTNSGWIVFADSVGHLRHFDAFPMLASLRNHGTVAVPATEEPAFLARLYGQISLPRLALPDELALVEVAVAPSPHLALTVFGGGMRGTPARDAERLTAELSFSYGDLTVVQGDPRKAIADVANRRLVRRDTAAESAALVKLAELGFRKVPEYDGNGPAAARYELPRRDLAGAVRSLLDEGWRVEAEGKPYRRAARFEMSVTSGVDWFDLHAEIDFEGVAVGLPELLRALRRGDGLVVLGDGSLGMLPEEWLRKHAPLAEMGTVDGARVRFQRAQAGVLDALLASQPDASVDALFAKARDQLRRFAGVTAEEPPAAFRGQLRPYQQMGLGWLSFLRRFGLGGCLADDMGLGKTIQVLAMLAGRPRRRGRPSIVVVPKSLIWNWQHEAARFTPKLRVLAHVGVERAPTAAVLRDQLARTDVLLTTYGTLRKDVVMLREIEADYLILDEAQAIKNATSDSAKAARLLRGDHRLALSGTPIENHLGELWSLIEFLNPGLLGSARVFAAAAGTKRPDPEAKALLARVLRPFILRRTKEEVAPELPGKHEETIFCEMEPEQRRLYDELREHYRAALLGRIAKDGLGRAKIQVLEALLRLRQAACHPGLIDPRRRSFASGKMDVLMARLDEVRSEGHKALVFSQFTSFLSLVRDRLDAARIPYAYLDGETTDRQASVERFQSDATCPLFLLSLKAGGVGLNLTAADYVFILDPWWNPATEAQAVDRAHRIGQTKRVFVYRLLCRGTVEEKVAALQETKRDLAASFMSADGSPMQALDRETLELLLA